MKQWFQERERKSKVRAPKMKEYDFTSIPGDIATIKRHNF